MKKITKIGAPHNYINWRKDIVGTSEEHYRRLRNPLKGELHDVLLKEQGYLCAYTLKRIKRQNSHIEHIKPESVCRSEENGTGTDLDYDNMVTCYPRSGMKKPFRYGAPLKDAWWEEEGKNFVSPLTGSCETCFKYNADGQVAAVGNYEPAKITIDLLALNHPSLAEERKNAIAEFIYGSKALSLKQTEKAIKEIYDKNATGKLKVFCVAVHHALLDYQKLLQKRMRKRKAMRSKNTK